MALLLEDAGLLLLEAGFALLAEDDTSTGPVLPQRWRPPSPWAVQLCRKGQTIAVCTAGRLLAKQRQNTAGEWSLETSPAGVPPAGYLDPTGAVDDLVEFDPRDVDGVRLVGEGRVLYDGQVAGDNGGWWGEKNAGDEVWRWTGICRGWHLLASRLAFPTPEMASGWVDGHDERTGVASTVLTEYIEANLGAAAIAERQRSGVQVADEQVGPTMPFSARLQPLSELASRIASDGGFEVICEYDFGGEITYRLSLPRDMSSLIVFSDQGDLSESQARFTQRSATWVVAGGTGLLTDRTFRFADTGAVGDDRYEVFSDVSALAVADEVQADADARLGLAADQFAISTTLTDTATRLALSTGLRLGDRIGIVVRGRRYTAPIEGVEFEVAPNVQVMRPQFGVAEPNELVALKRRLTDLHDQVNTTVA